MLIRRNSFVSGYSFNTRKRKKTDNFIKKLVIATSAISILLVSVSVALIAKMPKEAFSLVLNTNKETAPLEEGFLYPKPTDDIRAKADRLRTLRYEEYLDRCYLPLDGEMDNVYVYDYDKKCYLTFDDGPSSVTPVILDVLKQYKVKATFFVTGQQAEANPQTVKDIYNAGHAIGNHSYSHEYDTVYDTLSSFKNEVKKCKDAIDEALGKEYDNLIFRFPGGYTSLSGESSKLSYRSILSDMGYKYIDWSCLTGDSNTTEPTQDFLMDTLKSTVGNSKTGDIVVLMHDSPSKEITAKALPKIIEYLYESGYQFECLTNK